MGKDLNLDLFGPGPDPEGAENSPPPVSSDDDSEPVGGRRHSREARGSADSPVATERGSGPEAEENGTETREVWTVSQVNSAVRALLEEHQVDVTVYGLTVTLRDGRRLVLRDLLRTLPPPRYSSENAARCAAWIAEEAGKHEINDAANRST